VALGDQHWPSKGHNGTTCQQLATYDCRGRLDDVVAGDVAKVDVAAHQCAAGPRRRELAARRLEFGRIDQALRRARELATDVATAMEAALER
jgi:hypothetical protein